MTHETATEKLLDLAYGELSPREAREVEAHAAGCAECREALARIRGTRAVMSRLPPERAPERGEAVLLAAAREAARRRPPPRILPGWLWGASVVAVLLLAVGAVSYRIVAMRPAPLLRDDPEVLMGGGAPPDPPAQREVAPGRPEPAPRAADGGADAAPRRSEPAPRAADGGAGAAPRRPEPAPRAADGGAGAAPSRPAPAAPAVDPAPSAAQQRSARSSAPSAAGARDEAIVTSEDPAARYGALRAAGQLRGEVATFEDCPGEQRRELERDPDGRVVKYTRRGERGGVPFEAELFYRTDGTLGAARFREEGGAWRPLRPGGGEDPAAGLPQGVLAPREGSGLALDDPPRCAVERGSAPGRAARPADR